MWQYKLILQHYVQKAAMYKSFSSLKQFGIYSIQVDLVGSSVDAGDSSQSLLHCANLWFLEPFIVLF